MGYKAHISSILGNGSPKTRAERPVALAEATYVSGAASASGGASESGLRTESETTETPARVVIRELVRVVLRDRSESPMASISSAPLLRRRGKRDSRSPRSRRRLVLKPVPWADYASSGEEEPGMPSETPEPPPRPKARPKREPAPARRRVVESATVPERPTALKNWLAKNDLDRSKLADIIAQHFYASALGGRGRRR